MAYSQATLIQRIRNFIDDDSHEDVATNTPGTGTTLTVADAAQYAVGDVFESITNGDLARVKSVDSATQLTLRRNYAGTTAAAWALGEVFTVNPEFRRTEILEAISSTIDDLFPWVYAVDTATLTFASGQNYYSVPSTFLGLISLTQDLTVTAGQYRILDYGAKGSGAPVKIVQGLAAAISATGIGLWVPGVRVTPTTAGNLRYARLVTDTVSSGNYTDLDSRLGSVVMYGACAWLLEGGEIDRVTDDVSSGDQSVGPAARVRDAGYFQGKYERKRYSYNLWLVRTAPVREWVEA